MEVMRMIVYSLNYKDNPTVPFYFGITNDVERRFKQHKYNYKRHQPYIKKKDDFFIQPLYDTGDNEYSQILAEKIETTLIKQYATLNYGSNRVYDVREYFHEKGIDVNKRNNPQAIAKAKQTRERKNHKKFKKVIRLIHDDPYQYTLDEIVDKTGFSTTSLNRYTKKYHDISFMKWLHQYQKLWMDCIIQRIENSSSDR
jgi:AraC-like DNA-binding protein